VAHQQRASRTRGARRWRAGFALTDVLIAIAVFSLAIPALALMLARGQSQVVERAAGEQLREVARASDAFMRENYDALIASAGPGSPSVLGIDDLRDQGFLSDSFPDRNPWDQRYRIWVNEPRPDDLEALVLTEGGRGLASAGADFAAQSVPAAAAAAGAAGGFTPTGDVGGESVGTARGVFGGWEVDLPARGIADPGPGHLAALIFFDDASLLRGQFLHRVEVPGQPELNRMQTDIDMDNNTLDDALEASTRTGQDLTRAVTDALVVANGSEVAKPDCRGGQAPAIYVAPAMASYNAEGRAMSAVQTWAENVSAARWRVRMRVRVDAGWRFPDWPWGQIMVFTKCR